MNKLKNATEEMNFISSTGSDELVDYINEYPFQPQTEKFLVETGPKDAVLLYIELYGLKSAAAVVVFRSNKEKFVNALLAWCHKDKALVKTFLSYGDYNCIKAYLKDFNVKSFRERGALERFDKAELLEMATNTTLSPFAKYDILVRGDAELRAAVIKRKGLDKRELDYVLYNGSPEDLDLLISLQNGSSLKEAMMQIRILRFAKRKVVANYVSRHKLYKEALEYFLKTAPFDLLVSYVKHFHPEGGDIAILNHPDRSGIFCYLSKNWLTEEGEHLLLKRGEHDEIKTYIKHHHLNPDDEVRLIKRGKHREIVLYLERHSLSAEAQVEFVYRRNKSELFFWVTAYPETICDKAVDMLFKCGFYDLLDTYDELLKERCS